jgi:chaperonin GroES
MEVVVKHCILHGGLVNRHYNCIVTFEHACAIFVKQQLLVFFLFLRTERRDEMKVKPLNDRVLVQRVDAEEKTTGGIIIPDTAKEKTQEGKIVAAGPGKRDENGKRIPMDVKKDDRVLFGKYAGTEIKIDGVELLIMRIDDILGIIEK